MKRFIALTLILFLVTLSLNVLAQGTNQDAIKTNSHHKYGDINGDNVHSWEDVRCIWNEYMGYSTKGCDYIYPYGDVDGNGKITPNDALLIVKIGALGVKQKYGDANGDRNHDMEDINCIMNAFLGKVDVNSCPFVYTYGDVNGDGKITPGDARIVYLISGL